MLFHTPEFLALFLAVFPLAVWGGSRTRRVALLAASYAFYMWFSFPLVGLLIFSSGVDFVVGQRIHASRDAHVRKRLLVASLAANLGVLFFFKYTNWFLGSLGGACQLMTGEDPFPFYDIVLPLGISFYTFQSMSYTIDIYRGRLEPTRSPLTFALYVAFFPQLVAGPIVRAASLVPQLDRGPRHAPGQIVDGAGLFTLGLFKKVVVADALAPIVDQVFVAPGQYGGADVLLATYAFAFQIYCDFSGYTDMARGLAALLGYRIDRNFDAPYFARGVRDFWRRWHISLSTWLRDYLYVPLGGNRGSRGQRSRNVMITMLLGGLWHGASWTFVVWGAIHGVWIVAEHAIGERWPRSAGLSASAPGRILAALLTFHGVCLAWVFFRAETTSGALALLARLGDWSTPASHAAVLAYALPVLAFDGLVRLPPLRLAWQRSPALVGSTLWAGWVLALLLGQFHGADFVYFQF